MTSTALSSTDTTFSWMRTWSRKLSFSSKSAELHFNYCYESSKDSEFCDTHMHMRFGEKRSRQNTAVGVFVRFIWVALLLKYSHYRKIYCFTDRCAFLWNRYLFLFRQRDTHAQTSKKGNLTSDLPSQLFQLRTVVVFVVTICKS